jgi:hypothetical protein
LTSTFSTDEMRRPTLRAVPCFGGSANIHELQKSSKMEGGSAHG